MTTCPTCGGTIGVDCFNPEECAYITEAMNREQGRADAAAQYQDDLATLTQQRDALLEACKAAESFIRSITFYETKGAYGEETETCAQADVLAAAIAKATT